ncbi:hypothetical protein ES702_01123 [subsurface metagenome]
MVDAGKPGFAIAASLGIRRRKTIYWLGRRSPEISHVKGVGRGGTLCLLRIHFRYTQEEAMPALSGTHKHCENVGVHAPGGAYHNR